jgi:monoamine oxidase
MKPKNFRMAQSPLANALRLARLANRSDTPPADELVEMQRESARPGARASWTRRRFLKTSGAATLALAGGGLLTSCARTKGAPRIAVIGAGLAGLNAAYTLKKLGHRAEVYEAAKRMGGRIYTVKDVLAPGLVTDIGGEWLNTHHDESISLVEELGLELSDLRAPSESRLTYRTYHFGGVHYTEAQVIESFQPIVERMEDDIATLGALWRAESEDDRAKAVSLITPFDRISVAEYLENIGVTGWLHTLLNVAATSESALDTFLPSSASLPRAGPVLPRTTTSNTRSWEAARR